MFHVTPHHILKKNNVKWKYLVTLVCKFIPREASFYASFHLLCNMGIYCSVTSLMLSLCLHCLFRCVGRPGNL